MFHLHLEQDNKGQLGWQNMGWQGPGKSRYLYWKVWDFLGSCFMLHWWMVALHYASWSGWSYLGWWFGTMQLLCAILLAQASTGLFSVKGFILHCSSGASCSPRTSAYPEVSFCHVAGLSWSWCSCCAEDLGLLEASEHTKKSLNYIFWWLLVAL